MVSISGSKLQHSIRLVAGFAAIVVYVWYFKSRVNQSDFLVFYRAGVAVAHGVSPYPSVGSTAVFSGSSFVYPFVVAYFFVPFTLVSPLLAAWIYVGISIAAIGSALWLLDIRGWLSYVFFLSSSVVIVAWQMGTLNPLFVVGIALAWRYRNNAFILGTVVSGIAFAKLFLLALLVWLVLAKRFRALVVAVLGIASFSALSFASGPLSIRQYALMLSKLAKHEAVSGFSAASILRSIGWSQITAEVVVVASVLIAAWLLNVVYKASKDESVLVAGSVLIALMVTPILWSSYLILFGFAFLVVRRTIDVSIAFALGSWLVVTPDRAQLGVVALFVVLIALGGLYVITRISASKVRRLHVKLLLKRALGGKGVLLVLAPLTVLVVLVSADPNIVAAVTVQVLLLCSFATLLKAKYPSGKGKSLVWFKPRARDQGKQISSSYITSG